MGQRARKRLAAKISGDFKPRAAVKQRRMSDSRNHEQRKEDKTAVHPSWKAKKEMNDAAKISLHNPAGKKIVFED